MKILGVEVENGEVLSAAQQLAVGGLIDEVLCRKRIKYKAPVTFRKVEVSTEHGPPVLFLHFEGPELEGGRRSWLELEDWSLSTDLVPVLGVTFYVRNA